MADNIIPAELWPEGAIAHTWDSSGRGWWLACVDRAWAQALSRIPMPAGWDWRVPVMRPVAGIPVSAPAIDLGQIREAFPVLDDAGIDEVEHCCEHSIAHERNRLALIDGQASVHSDAVVWVNRCNRTVPEALRYLANHPRPDGGEQRFNAAHLFQLADEIEHMASAPLYAAPMLPTKGEGVDGG